MSGGKGGGGDGGGDSEQTIRYAPYLEAAHQAVMGGMNVTHNFTTIFNATLRKQYGLTDAQNENLVASPYRGYEQIDVKEGYFGMTTLDPSETYYPKNFPSLWDMFGKFMAGLDVHDLWGQVYDDVIQGPEIENVITAHSEMLQNDIDTKIMPNFLAGMRDINSVQATSFVIGKAIIQDAHVRELNKFGAQVRMHALDSSVSMWASHLEWNKTVIATYSEMFKLYYTSHLDIDRVNLEYLAKDDMWNLNLFESARAMIGAMHGAAAAAGRNEPSTTQKAIGGAMTGAAGGAMLAQAMSWSVPGGALIGGLLGLASAFF